MCVYVCGLCVDAGVIQYSVAMSAGKVQLKKKSQIFIEHLADELFILAYFFFFS